MLNSLYNTITIGTKVSALTVIVPLVYISLLFINSKFFKKGEFNESYFDKSQTKFIKGFCAIGIILHHLAQKTAAPWLKSQYIIHGLDFFVNIGYLFVGTFFFISGYGLYKSYKTNKDFFDHYFSRRILPLIIAYLTTSLTYYFYKPVSSTYTWYVFAIIICYILFYFGFKYFKKEIVSCLVIIVGIVLYSVFCNFMMLGGWWYNSIGLFIIGLIFSIFEKRILSFIKKYYIPLLIVGIMLTVVCNWYGRHYENVVFPVTKESTYDLYNLYIILFRFIAAINFTLTVILVSLKFKFNNKVLSFYGSISLEFYLIQGLFVQMFSYCYFDINIKPLYYIKSVPLYMLVVILLSTLFAFGLNYVDKKIKEFLLFFAEKRREEILFVWKYLKITLIVIVSTFIIYVLALSLKSYSETKGYKEAINKYKDNYISFTNVGNKKMAAYIVGEGEDTLVLMRGNDDPCPTLSMRFLADKLSEDYKVVVLDYLGTGFSDKPSTSRTSKNIIYEIHEALKGFGITENYILVPEYISGIYAQEYVKKYKNEVKGVIAIETENLPERKAITKYLGASAVEYHKTIKIDSFTKYLISRLKYIKGVETLIWPVVEDFYNKGLKEEELVVARKLFFDNIYNSAFLDERFHELENLYNSLSAQYPRQIYVYDIINNADKLSVSCMGQKLEELHAETCFNRSKHGFKIINDIYKSFYIEPGIIKKIVDESIGYMK